MSNSLALLEDEELLAALIDVERQARQLHAEMLRHVAEAVNRSLAGRIGYRDTAGLIRDLQRVSESEAKRRVLHARQVIDSHARTAAGRRADLSHLRSALVDGEIGPAHITVVLRTLKALPAWISTEDFVHTEKVLVEAGRDCEARTLSRLGRDIIAELNQDGSPPDDAESADRRNELSLIRRRDGRVGIKGNFDAETGDVLTELLNQPAKPRSVIDQPEPRSIEERQGAAFSDLLRHAAGADAELEAAAVRPPRVAPPLSGLTCQGGSRLVRHRSCDPEIIPTPIIGRELPDIDRSGRAVSPALRAALVRRDDGCAFPGCDQPHRWTDAHRIRDRADGGRTKLDNLVLLCRAHHRLIHHSRWQVTVASGRPRFTPPDLVHRRRGTRAYFVQAA